MTRGLEPIRLVLVGVLVLGLAACQDSEDRAARHLASAQALVASGDLDAAVLEFRNVLELAPTNRDALTQLAGIQIASGAEGAAFGTYQRLVDNHPDATEGWLSLAEISIRQNRWDAAATYAVQAEALAPEDARTALIRAALDFRTAVETKDADMAAAAAQTARRHVADDPGNLIARQVLIAQAGEFLGPEAAVAEIDAALEVLPGIYVLHQIRIQTLAELGRTEAIGPALERMAQQFPGNPEPRQELVNWYLSQGDADSVERFLRSRAEADAAELSDSLSLVNFLREVRGPDPALAEIDRQIAAMAGDTTGGLAVLQGLRATLVFDSGKPDEAITDLQSVLGTMPAGAEANNLRVALARMLATVGREDDARAAVDTVLAQDSGHVDASKIKAQWLIAQDQADEAVRLLRQAQATAPRDAEVVRLMGDAHARAGNWELAGERYATAVDLSGKAPLESLIYANFLVSQGRPGPAETVLVDALREAPNDPELLAALTGLQLRENRLDQARIGIDQLRALGTDAARRTAASLEADLLLRENRTDDVRALVERMAAEGDADAQRLTELVEAQIAEGKIEDAKAMLAQKMQSDPDDLLLRFLRAGIHLVEGEAATAETIYREILAADPTAAPPLRVLYGLLRQQGREDEAQALLAQVQAAAPDALLPRLLLAERAERIGDVEGAIALYEGIYADDSSYLVVANNLANLLLTRADDTAALDRAYAITRRLRGTEVPAFQDTYGWIAYLRGDYETALEYLSAAAVALPEEPTVQYHLGMTYLALKRPEEARTALERSLELAGDTPLPDADRAREALEGL